MALDLATLCPGQEFDNKEYFDWNSLGWTYFMIPRPNASNVAAGEPVRVSSVQARCTTCKILSRLFQTSSSVTTLGCKPPYLSQEEALGSKVQSICLHQHFWHWLKVLLIWSSVCFQNHCVLPQYPCWRQPRISGGRVMPSFLLCLQPLTIRRCGISQRFKQGWTSPRHRIWRSLKGSSVSCFCFRVGSVAACSTCILSWALYGHWFHSGMSIVAMRWISWPHMDWAANGVRKTTWVGWVAVTGAGAMAEKSEQHNISKYSHLDSIYMFILLAIETSGVFGQQSLSSFKTPGNISEQPQMSLIQSSSFYREFRWPFFDPTYNLYLFLNISSGFFYIIT